MTKKKNVIKPLFTQWRRSSVTPEPPTRIESTVCQTRAYEPASMLTQTSAASVAASRNAALPVSVRRKSRSGVSRLRAQAVRPENAPPAAGDSAIGRKYLDSLLLRRSVETRRTGMSAADAADGLHRIRFPNESDEYRSARDALLREEIALRRHTEAVAKQRRSLPLGGAVPTDYEFAGTGGAVRLSELFENDKNTLFLYNFMFIPGAAGLPLEGACPSCTSIIDAMDGEAPHIEQRVNFAVVAKAPLEQFTAHAVTRGWRHARLLSSAGTTYNADYQGESDGSQHPIATVFVRRNDTIHHFWSSEVYFARNDPGEHPRHVDFLWPLWAVLDRTPEGRSADWGPELEYQ